MDETETKNEQPKEDIHKRLENLETEYKTISKLLNVELIKDTADVKFLKEKFEDCCQRKDYSTATQIAIEIIKTLYSVNEKQTYLTKAAKKVIEEIKEFLGKGDRGKEEK